MIRNLFVAVLPLILVDASCPSGTIYESLFNKCYKYVNQPLGFLAAEENCQTMGGHLVAVSNAFENAYISGIAAQGGAPSKYWIGANLLRANKWTWISNEPFLFNNWALGEPSDPSAKQCSSVRDVDNLWTKELCYSTFPSVCAISPNAPPTQPTCSSSTCPPYQSTSCENAVCSEGYNLFPQTCKCYKYYSEAVLYSQADDQCSDYNGTLAKISSVELNDFLFALWSYDRYYAPFIGLKCNSSSVSSCYWPDGSNAIGYSNFAPGNPSSEELTTYMDFNGQWRSFSLNTGTSTYICENAPESVHQILLQRRNVQGNIASPTPIE